MRNHRLVMRFLTGLLIHPSSFRVSSFSRSDLKEWWIWTTIRPLTDFIEWMEPVLSSSTKPRRRSKVISWGYSHGCIHALKSCLTELAMGLDGPSPCINRVPTHLENLENLEKWGYTWKTWKYHGILKKLINIMGKWHETWKNLVATKNSPLTPLKQYKIH